MLFNFTFSFQNIYICETVKTYRDYTGSIFIIELTQDGTAIWVYNIDGSPLTRPVWGERRIRVPADNNHILMRVPVCLKVADSHIGLNIFID